MISVTGTYTTPDGEPANGTVTFTPRGWARDMDTAQVVPAVPIVVPITAGQLAVELPLIPEVWEVVEQVGDATNLIVTPIGADVDMSELRNALMVGEAGPHEHSNYPTRDEFNELLVEVDALATSKGGGSWQHVTPYANAPGTFTLTDVAFDAATNTATFHNTDMGETTHGWAAVEPGDFMDIVQSHGTAAGIYQIVSKDTVDNTTTFTLSLYRGQGEVVDEATYLVKLYHLTGADLAELDERYILREAANSSYKDWLLKADGNKRNPADFATKTYVDTELDKKANTHSHPYASSSHTHSYAPTTHTHDYSASNHTHSIIFRSGTSTTPSLSKGEPFLNTTYNVIYVGT
jgi:hypothetical protein